MQTRFHSIVLFIAFVISCSGSALARVTPIGLTENSPELQATITTVSGREITGEFRFAYGPSLQHDYGFRSSPKDKFRALDLDTIVRLVVSNENGVIGQFESMPLYFVYAKNDDGSYDFHSEVTDEDGLEDILSDEEEDND